MVRITKDVLRQLNVAAGKLDTDSGKVFVRFVGHPGKSDNLWHGDLQFNDPGDNPPVDTVSIQSIVATDAVAKPAKTVKQSRAARVAKEDKPTIGEK